MAQPKEEEREGDSSQSGRRRHALDLACEKKGISKLCRVVTYNYLKSLKAVFYNLKIIKYFQYDIQLTTQSNPFPRFLAQGKTGPCRHAPSLCAV